MISFIPLITYHLSEKLGIVRVRHKLMISITGGMYITYIAGSKFIWSESISALICWIMVVCAFNAWDKKNKGTRFAMSVLLGFLCAVAYATDVRLLALTVALVLTILTAHFVFHEKVLNLPAFGISLLLSFTAEFFVRTLLREHLWGDNATFTFTKSLGSFLESFFSGIYAFMTTTLGMGALACAIFVVMTLMLVREGIRKRVETPESNTKVYEPIKHTYSLRLTLFALFQFLVIGCSEIFTALFLTNSTGSRLTAAVCCGENTAPFALFLVMVFIIQYGIDLKKLLLAVGIYAYSCLCFALSGFPLTDEVAQAQMLFAVIPFGDVAEFNASPMTYLIISSGIFSLYALIIVVVSCTRKHRTVMVSTSIFTVFVLSSAMLAIVLIPSVGAHNSERTAPHCEVFELLYNSPQSPPIVVYEAEVELAGTIQFLAPDTPVSHLSAGDKIPDSCLLITRNGTKLPKANVSYDNVGKTPKYTVYAFGETARNFIRYSSQTNRDSQHGSSTSSSTTVSQSSK